MDSRKGAGDDYVTIVSVGNPEGKHVAAQDASDHVTDVPFVTVLSIGQRPPEEEVIIYRLPGEKLGFGLKFEGGTKSSECVRRLFIQSCAPDSPAGRARAAWGPLQPGDEILQIDGLSITNLTRLECVRRLKDSNVAVSLLVRHDDVECALEAENKLSEETANGVSKVGVEPTPIEKQEEDKASLPPPVPPRKLNRKNALNAVTQLEVNKAADCNKGAVGKQSPGRPRRLPPAPHTPPAEAQVYTDLFCQEKEHGILVAESESDDTGSSISTVIDRLSVYSSFPGSVENSIPSTPTLGYKQLNLNNVFNCLDNISLLSDIPPSIVEENVKILSKSSNASTPPEKAAVLNDVKASTTTIKRDERTSVVTVSTANKDFESSPREKLSENVFAKESPNSDNNNNYSQKSDTINKDTNNINVQVISKSPDVVDCPVVFNKKVAEKKSTMEPPKPKPRNMNKKHGTENTFSGRQFDDNLSLTKLHCIESWLQDSISCKNSEEPSYTREEDVPAVRPEALPRLIDFVPKTHVFKSQAETTETKEKLSPSSIKTIESDISEENANHLRLIITRDPCQDWCNSNASPQLETIYENFSTCPTLLIEESSRHPPAGDSGSDQGTLVSVEQNKGSDLSAPELRDRNPGSKKEIDVSHRRQDSEECGGESRGPRPPPDGRENPLVHHEDLPPPPPLTLFLREPPKTLSLTLPSKTTTANPKDSKRYEHGMRSLPDSPVRMVKTSDKSYGGRGKDVKSEGSVKDKIAMFSVNKTTSKEPPAFNHQISYNSLDKRVNHNSRVNDIVPDYTPPARKYSLPSEPMVKTYEIKEWLAMPKTVDAIERPDPLRDYPRYTTKPQVKEVEPKISPIVLLNLALAANPAKTDMEKKLSHKTTLDQLIEQRKKSMNKLRGLVIPESQSLTNLPEIKSRDSLKVSSSSNIGAARNETTKPTEASKMTAAPSLTSLWDNSAIINNVPKYSPAFKRKSLQVYGPKSSNTLDALKYSENLDSNMNKSIDSKGPVPIKPPRTSLDMKRPYDHREFSEKNQTLPPSFRAPAIPSPLNILLSPQVPKSKGQELQYNDAVDSPTFKTPKIFPEAADSDDSSYLSTVSSPTPSLNTVDNTESDCSSQCMLSQKYQHFSKNEGAFDYGLHNPMYQPDNEKTNVCRSLSSDTSHSAGSSNSSTLTSGSQASCSSAGSSDNGNRVLKPRSIEAINRKNILASAKCRSGKDNKFGSPLIERKFSDVESTDDDITQKHAESQYSKPRSDGGLANSILKVAYSTLVVEDKCPETDSTYSDTESDCDLGSVTLPKADLPQSKPKYTNGSSLNSRKTNEVVYNRRSSDTYAKPPLDQVKRVSENGASKNNNIEISRSVKTKTDFEESIAVFPVESKKCEYESLDASSCGVSEDEQENWCEVILSRGASGGVGVTLAGGADCEAKQVTIHKVLLGSAAERDGRLRKGDRVMSINGHTMKGVTHSQSVAILKEQLPEVSIVVCGKRTVENPSAATLEDSPTSAVVSVVLEKTDDLGAGLGMSLQGGGSRPLLINKLFTGGAAANSGSITSGSELLSVGGSPMAGLTRTQAWTIIRTLPIGPFTLQLRPQ